jgi:outer membrane protein assembly factor BamB
MSHDSSAADSQPADVAANDNLHTGNTANKRRWDRGRFPPHWLLAVLSVCGLTIVGLWLNLSLGDHAPKNILGNIQLFLADRANVHVFTLILSFLAFLNTAAWFMFLSSYSAKMRFMVPLVTAVSFGLIVLGVIIGVASGALRVHFSGTLLPQIQLRRPPVAVPARPLDQTSDGVDLLPATAEDFPQFLGSRRDLIFDTVQLDRDWQTHPPKLVWRQPIGAGWSGFAAVNGFAVTLEQRGENEMVTCYDVLTGELKWWHAIKARHATVLGGVGPRSTPTIHEGRVYALGATGVLRCLDGATGREVWPGKDLLEIYRVPPGTDGEAIAWGRAASPLIVDNLVVVPAGGPKGGPYVSLVAFDKNSGDKVWEAGDRQVSYSSPNLATIGGVRQILIVNEDNVSSHDSATGKILWQDSWPGSSTTNASASQAVALPGDHVWLSKGYGAGAKLLHVTLGDNESWRVEEAWANPRVLKTKFTNIAVHGDYVYGLSDGVLECVEWKSGRSLWKRGRYGHGQILRVSDVLLVISESGELVMIEATPDGHNALGHIQTVSGKTWNNLCLYGRHLLVRNAEEAACYELPATGLLERTLNGR